VTRRAQAVRLIEWTGERCVPWAEDAQMVYEHLHRYWFAAGLAEGRDVLDIGSGEGYGAALLAESAASVVGIELDAQAVAHSQANYAAPNLSFVQGSALELGRFDDESFDLVVCFELIEHLADHEGLLGGIDRVLRPDGLLVLSTPDRRIYTEAHDYHNPFHVRELSEPELRTLLAGWFPNVRLWGQHVSSGSNLVGLDEAGGDVAEPVVVDREGGRWERVADAPPVYLVAVASRSPLPALPGRYALVDPGLQILRREEARHEATRQEAAQLQRERDELRGRLARLDGMERALAESEDERERMGRRVAELEEAAADVRQVAAEAQDRIAALEPWEARALELERRTLALTDQISALEAQARRGVAAEHLAQARAREAEELRAQIDQVASDLAQAWDAAASWEGLFRYVVTSRGWRLLERLRGLRARLLPRGTARQEPAALPMPPPASPPVVATTAVAGPEDDPEHEPQPEAPAAGVFFTPTAAPAASIVIPVHGLAEMTLRCLAALAANTPPALAEVIVVDDASGPEVGEALNAVQGITVLRNEQNLGFLGSSNRGAAAASGRHVVFLNNDTEVQPGWLEALLDAIESAHDVGAVGSKLVYPDGRLQEAGCIVWSDASAWNVGRWGDPEAPDVNYRREVDYCSANGLIVRRDLLEALGGFDGRYAPAYYEDADLCFALHAAGHRVLYEPRSVIVHHEGASHGTDGAPTAGKMNQYANQPVFRAKWAHVLAGHWPSGTAGGLRGGRIDHARRVLVVDMWVPAHDRDSGSLRMTWILRLLRSLGDHVTLFPQNRLRAEPYSSQMQAMGIEVHYGHQTFSEFAAARAGLYDVVILSRLEVASDLLDETRRHFPDALVVYDTVDLHFLRAQRREEVGGTETEKDEDSETLRRRELDCVRRSDVTWAVTEHEEQMIRRLVPGAATATVPNVHQVDAERLRPFDERRDLVFVGGFLHPPNIDAVTWFVEEILPLVRSEIEVVLWVLGSSPPPAIYDLQSPNVVVTGWLPDLSEYLRSARVFVSPLRWGAGMKGKNGEAMAYGLPMVTTMVGAEGMHLVDGEHALIRDDASGFAEAVVELYRNQDLWERIAGNGQARVRSLWTPEVVREKLTDLLDRAGHGSVGRPSPIAEAKS